MHLTHAGDDCRGRPSKKHSSKQARRLSRGAWKLNKNALLLGEIKIPNIRTFFSSPRLYAAKLVSPPRGRRGFFSLFKILVASSTQEVKGNTKKRIRFRAWKDQDTSRKSINFMSGSLERGVEGRWLTMLGLKCIGELHSGHCHESWVP